MDYGQVTTRVREAFVEAEYVGYGRQYVELVILRYHPIKEEEDNDWVRIALVHLDVEIKEVQTQQAGRQK